MNEKQRRARRRAAARAWKKEAKGLNFWQRVTLRALNRAYRKPLKPFIPLVPTLPEVGMARLQVGPEIVYFDEVADVPEPRASADLLAEYRRWAEKRGEGQLARVLYGPEGPPPPSVLKRGGPAGPPSPFRLTPS